LQHAIEADRHGIVKDRLAHHLDHAAEPSFLTRSHRFFADLQAIIDFSERQKNHSLNSVTAVMSWRDHLIGVLMRGVFEQNFGQAGRSIAGPFSRFVDWIFDTAIGRRLAWESQKTLWNKPTPGLATSRSARRRKSERWPGQKNEGIGIKGAAKLSLQFRPCLQWV
jgi:hypothetical protein